MLSFNSCCYFPQKIIKKPDLSYNYLFLQNYTAEDTELTPLTSGSKDEDDETNKLIHSQSEITVTTSKKPGIRKPERKHPEPSTSITQMDRGECLDRIGKLCDDVDKLFDMPKKFDIAALCSDTNIVMSEAGIREEVPQIVIHGDKYPFSEEDYRSKYCVKVVHTAEQRSIYFW